MLDEKFVGQVLGFKPAEPNALVKWFLDMKADVNFADAVCCFCIYMFARVHIYVCMYICMYMYVCMHLWLSNTTFVG